MDMLLNIENNMAPSQLQQYWFVHAGAWTTMESWFQGLMKLLTHIYTKTHVHSPCQVDTDHLPSLVLEFGDILQHLRSLKQAC